MYWKKVFIIVIWIIKFWVVEKNRKELIIMWFFEENRKRKFGGSRSQESTNPLASIPKQEMQTHVGDVIPSQFVSFFFFLFFHFKYQNSVMTRRRLGAWFGCFFSSDSFSASSSPSLFLFSFAFHSKSWLNYYTIHPNYGLHGRTTHVSHLINLI